MTDTDTKTLATLQARAALAGYTLERDPMGGFYVMRWGLMRMFDTLAEAEAWIDMVTGGSAW